MTATARARPNIALVKYWGKRDAGLNLPAAGSLSITLDALYTQTRVDLDPVLRTDTLRLNGADDAPAQQRVSACLDVLRARAGVDCRARVETHNNFPTAAGLASSASGFAALVMAASAAMGLDADRQYLSTLARQGSGSAARSMHGGFVLMHGGRLDDGSDAFAEPIAGAADWPLEVVVAVTTQATKSVASGAGMERTRLTSPYHEAWVASVEDDLAAARAAIAARDFRALGEVSEHSCLKMHADMLATRPPLLYWNAVTVACIEGVRRLREHDGLDVFFTIDAGPQLKAVCLPGSAARVADALAGIPGVVQILRSGLGAGAQLQQPAVAGAGEVA